MISRFPQKFSVKWLGVYFASFLILCVIILASTALASVLLGGNAFDLNIMILFVLVAIANLLVAFFGFFNGKYIFLMSYLSLLIGTINSSMIVAEDYDGWEYFAAGMFLVYYLLLGIIVGVLTETIILIKNRKNRKDNLEFKPAKWSTVLLIAYIILLIIPLVFTLIDYIWK